MAKKLWLAMAVLAGGLAQAQTFTFSDTKAKYVMNGCFFVEDGLRCDYTYTPDRDFNSYFSANKFQVVRSDGANIGAKRIKVAGQNWQESSNFMNFYSGVPVKLSVLFDVPKTTPSLPVMSVYGSTARNVSIGNAATSTPAPAPAANLNIAGNWNATLSNCKQTAANTVVCTATLRK